jgi:hypothetical protein
MATQIPQINKYIREMIATNGGSFNREAIFAQSKEWMEKFPVEFNLVLNMIEAEGRNLGCDEMMDDSTPSVAYGSRFADDSTSSVAYGSRFDDDSTPSVAYGSRFADDSTPSVAYGSRFADDSTPSVAYGSRFADDSTPSVAYGGYADDSTPSFAFGSRPVVESTPPVAPHHDEYSGNIMPDHISSVSDSPMGSDHIDSSPGGYPDDDFESDMPLQRTMSCAPSRR